MRRFEVIFLLETYRPFIVINKNKIILFCILFFGLFFRLYGNNWDQGWHLHPDERFLTMVGGAVTIPSSLSHYLDQHISSFNPVNKGHAFFVYGTLPILINKVGAQLLSNDVYGLFNLQGRVLAGIADFLVLLTIYKLVGLVEKKLKLAPSIKYASTFFYAIAVLPIQLSHFFTVDTFLNLFCWLSLYFAVRLNVQTLKGSNGISNMAVSGLFLGLACACKVSAVYFAPLIGIFIFIETISSFLSFPRTRESRGRYPLFKLKIRDWIPAFAGRTKVLFSVAIFFIAFYLALRLGSPYYFETGNIFQPQLSAIFVKNIQTLQTYDNPQTLFPPSIQWLSKTPDFSLINIIFFGVGPLYFLLSVGGIILLLKKKNIFITASIVWVMLFTLYQSLQFAKSMRYLILIYPFLALFAAVGMTHMFNVFKKFPSVIRYALHGICYILILFWPLAFMSLYTKDHSRVNASKWIYENIPTNSTLTYEYWDDPLPLTVQDPITKNFTLSEIHIFDPDTNEKWTTINNQLNAADYYIMSSNRGWGSISKAPGRYPSASIFYNNMFNGTGGFTFIKEISSYPSLRYLGIPLDFPDQWAEEAFTVYDHPLVYIFRKNK